ncbi:AlpA family phage regulatory protein [Colwellia psychrerythraea]|uniref:Uncharacterized protein n=1 Tax=Colwellia psychrerythraea (strain 34H / ATCC BAA-681) TaxID=167879 RepID=Q47ZX1_COLP3|nr:hypothetical protein CPS_2948 [Colwellia psychrerythraea 34H]
MVFNESPHILINLQEFKIRLIRHVEVKQLTGLYRSKIMAEGRFPIYIFLRELAIAYEVREV